MRLPLNVREVQELASVPFTNRRHRARSPAMLFAPWACWSCHAPSCQPSEIALRNYLNLLTRPPDVVLMTARLLRCADTPLPLGHIRAAILRSDRIGRLIMPPVPALLRQAQSVEEIIEHSSRAPNLFVARQRKLPRWGVGCVCPLVSTAAKNAGMGPASSDLRPDTNSPQSGASFPLFDLFVLMAAILFLASAARAAESLGIRMSSIFSSGHCGPLPLCRPCGLEHKRLQHMRWPNANVPAERRALAPSISRPRWRSETSTPCAALLTRPCRKASPPPIAGHRALRKSPQIRRDRWRTDRAGVLADWLDRHRHDPPAPSMRKAFRCGRAPISRRRAFYAQVDAALDTRRGQSRSPSQEQS